MLKNQMPSGLALLLLLLLSASNLALAERTREKMYTQISGASCFRRLNGTHQTGCQSERTGSVGALHLISREDDFDFLFTQPPAPPYAPLIPPQLFTRRNILRLRDQAAHNISVVLLINQLENMEHFSHELNCPNQYSGLLKANSTETITCDTSSSELSWNPFGTGLLHEDFPFPIYYISDKEEIDKLIDCFHKFNDFDYETQAQRRLCAVEIKAFMSAAVSSEVCIRRSNFINNLGQTKYCDPLEGRNVYATLFPRNVSAENLNESVKRQLNAQEKYIMVTTRLDTTSFFDGLGLGALDSLLGYATLVSVAHMLAQLLPQQSALPNAQRNVLFVLFNGESYDYIGSQRFVYDLQHTDFPTRSTQTNAITLQQIEFLLDIGTLDDISSIKLHSLSDFPAAGDFLLKMQKYAISSSYDFNLKFESEIGFKLPPTSAQSFLRQNLSFPAFILNAKAANPYYHSIYDDAVRLNFSYANLSLDYTALMEANDASKYFASNAVQMKVRNVSSVVAMALYETLMGVSYVGSKVANPLLVDEFLYCFLQSADCALFKAASAPNSLPGLPMPPMRYISVAAGSQEASGWTYRLMGYILSQKVQQTEENCALLPLHWFAGYDGKGECRLTTQNFTHALSPAFLIENYDWKSGEYSTWTESTWSQFGARIFLRPSKMHEITTLCAGIVMFIFSFCLVYIISSRSDVLFENAASSTDALTPTAC